MKTTQELLNGQATVKELLEGRAAVREQLRDIVRNAKKEDRSLNDEEKERFDRFDNDFEALTEKIELQKRIDKVNADEAEEQARKDPTRRAFADMTPKERELEERKAYWSAVLYGMGALSAEQRSMVAKYQVTLGGQQRGTSTQITSTDSLGGFIIPQTLQRELEKRMKYYGPFLGVGEENENVARILRTTMGEKITWPTLDDTGTVALAHDESNPSATVQDLTFSEKQLDAFTRNTGVVKVSVELMTDNVLNLEQEIFTAFGTRLGRKLNTDVTTGDGSGDPHGFVTAINAAAGTVNAADNTTIARTDLLSLIHGVDRAYRVGPNVGLMMHDSILKEIKALSFGSSDDRPLWQPSMREGEPDTIEGYRYFINNDMASTLTNDARTVAFGDWEKFVIRLVGTPTIFRLNERYMDLLQIGFIGYWRWDSELIQNDAIKLLRMTNT